MNIEPLKKLRDYFKFGAAPLAVGKGHVLGFNMNRFRGAPDDDAPAPHKCDTVACIGGHVVAYEEPSYYLDTNYASDIEKRAFEIILGDYDEDVEEYQALYDLFFPKFETKTHAYSDITINDAIKALDSFIETGKANWEGVMNG